MMTGGGLTRRGGCIYAARNGVGWGGLKEEAIYFLSGLETREKKKNTSASREGGARAADNAERILLLLLLPLL